MTSVSRPDPVRERLDYAPMSPTQVAAVAIACSLSALDGYEVLSVTFVAPELSAAWHVGKAALGVLLSSGLAGMALGAFLFAPVGDFVGRKTMVLLALALMATGMLLSALATSLDQLALYRIVTGLGIGTCVAIINPITVEFSNVRRRALSVAIVSLGYPLGGTVGGLLTASLVQRLGWPVVFAVGACAALLLIPVVALSLAESPGYLRSRRRPDALLRLNAVLKRCGHDPIDRLPEPEIAGRGYRAIVQAGQTGAALWITAVMMLFTATAYYVVSWMPQVIADAGFPTSVASSVAALSNGAGVAGGISLGLLGQRRGALRWLAPGAMVGFGIMAVTFGVMPPVLTWLILTAALCGFFLYAGISGAYTVMATTFRDEARASGSGMVSGAGRISSAIAPSLAGWMFASGLDRGQVSTVFGLCAAAAGIILFVGWRRFRTTSTV